MTLRKLLMNSIIDTPLEPVARAIYTAVLPTQAARYDRQLGAVIRRVMRSDSNSVDVGAHRGAILRELVRQAPLGTHIAVEPLQEHARYLASRFPAAHVMQCALSDQAGLATFFHVVSRPTRSGLRRVAYPSPHEEVVPIVVPQERLDQVVPSTLAVALIKIDVEGAEYDVLAGGRELILRDRPVIVFEHGPHSAEYYGISSGQVYELLANQYGLRVSTMARWLAQQVAFDEAAFIAEATVNRGFYFIAYP